MEERRSPRRDVDAAAEDYVSPANGHAQHGHDRTNSKDLKDKTADPAFRPAYLPAARSSAHAARRRGLGGLLFPGYKAAGAGRGGGQGSASTAYLDGLRGFASVCVLNSHVVCAFTIAPQVDWGWHDGEYLSPTSLPIIRLLFSGPGMVTLFFLISGFSCSLRPMDAMQHSDTLSQAKVLRNLSSSLIKRWFRLFLPAISVTFIVTAFVHLGGFVLLDGVLASPDLKNPPPKHISALPFFEQVRFWVDDLYEMMNIWHLWPNGVGNNGYYAPFTNPHMWFITIEFKASLILYLSLIALATAKPLNRFYAMAAMALYQYFAVKDEIMPYFYGACLAQVKLCIDNWRPAPSLGGIAYDRAGRLPAPLRELAYRNTRGASRLVWNVTLLISVWLMSTPAWSYSGPLFYWLTLFFPSHFARQQTLMQLVGVSGLLLCLMTSTTDSKTRKFLTSPTALYLGRISFAVYMIHGPVLMSIGYWVPIKFWQLLGVGGEAAQHPLLFVVGIALCEAVTILLSVVLADYFNRHVEARCVAAAGRVEAWMVSGSWTAPPAGVPVTAGPAAAATGVAKT